MFAAWSDEQNRQHSGIWVFKRGKKVDELGKPGHWSGRLRRIVAFGTWIVGCYSDRIQVWNSTSYEHYTTIVPTSSTSPASNILSGAICHVPTFLNKVFVGRADGAVDIWNVSTGKLIYTINATAVGAGAVTALQPSPSFSMLAIGREDGSVCLHDVLKDKVIQQLNGRTPQRAAITSISFRTDGLGAGRDYAENGVMATTTILSVDVTFWDLHKGGKVSGVLHGAHGTSFVSSGEAGSINKIEFLPGQDILITSGLDNALKSWIFDANSLSPTPRLLHQRSGHAAPITLLRFVPSNSDDADTAGKWLISAGRDRALWGWSTRKDEQSTELSQGRIQKKAKKLGVPAQPLETPQAPTLEDLKAPEIISLACSLNRDGGMASTSSTGEIWTNSTTRKPSKGVAEGNSTSWESVVTGHRGDRFARTWFWGRKRAGRWALETGDGTEVTTVAITACGTFAIVASAGGSISAFNLQSGIRRQKFPPSLTPAQARKLKLEQAVTALSSTSDHSRSTKYGPGQGHHEKAVTGVVVDSLNRLMISCGLDGKIKFWEFSSGLWLDEIDWFPMIAILASRYHRSSELLALSCDDSSIRVIDTLTKRVVRELWGCLGQINDFCFSHDGRWIVAASMDSAIRVWDLTTGHLINLMRLESQCTALAFSETGEYLATAHAESVGINLWNNRALFAYVPTRPLKESEEILQHTPTTSGENGQSIVTAAFDLSEEKHDEDELALISQQDCIQDLDRTMQTLSLVPKSRWQTLLHLDTIRQRNKPIEPPKAPEKAPFFLPSLENGQVDQAANEGDDQHKSISSTKAERSRISQMDRQALTSTFTNLLHSSALTANFEPFLAYFSNLSPSTADIEIRSLNYDELSIFVSALTFGLRERDRYELLQAWMSVFLRLHGQSIHLEPGDVRLRNALAEWKEEQMRESTRLGDLLGFCGGVIGFLRSER